MAPRGKGQKRATRKTLQLRGVQAQKGEREDQKPSRLSPAPEEARKTIAQTRQETPQEEAARTFKDWLVAQDHLGQAAETLYFAIGHGPFEKEARESWWEARRKEIYAWNAHHTATVKAGKAGY